MRRRGSIVVGVAASGLLPLVASSLLSIACTERSQGAASPQPPAESLATTSARANTPVAAPSAQSPTAQIDAAAERDAGAETFVAWTDPAGVRALLRGDPMPDDVKNSRACNFDVPEQSCVPNEQAVEWDCKLECANTCGECATRCKSTLTTCRVPCNGAGACDAACGQRAGVCVEACLTTRDRCYTGECAKRTARYRERWRTNFGCKAKLPALEICQKTAACIQHCQEQTNPAQAPTEACIDGCKKKLAVGCEKDFVDMASMGACGAFDTGI